MTQTHRIYSYGYLMMAAGAAHERAQILAKADKEPFIDSLNTVLHCALALEAFMNHLGAQAMPHWTPLKRKLSPVEKLETLAAHGSLQIDWSKSPYQSFKEAMTFRNLIVHAETEDVEAPGDSHEDHPQTKWQSFCTMNRAGRILTDTKDIIANLPGQLNLESIPSFLLTERTE